MVVAVCKISFLIHESNSLKRKRQVLKSLIQKVKNRYNISIAEVEDNDLWQKGTLGFCMIGNDSRFLNSAVDRALNFIRDLNVIDLIDCSVEMINFGMD